MREEKAGEGVVESGIGGRFVRENRVRDVTAKEPKRRQERGERGGERER